MRQNENEWRLRRLIATRRFSLWPIVWAWRTASVRPILHGPVKLLPKDNEIVRFLSEEEEEKIRSVIAGDFPEHMPEFEIALHTGARRGEQYQLTWPDVNVDERMTLRRTKNRTTQHIPLNAVARAHSTYSRKAPWDMAAYSSVSGASF